VGKESELQIGKVSRYIKGISQELPCGKRQESCGRKGQEYHVGKGQEYQDVKTLYYVIFIKFINTTSDAAMGTTKILSFSFFVYLPMLQR